jgi:histidinol-phosphatase
MSEHRPPLDEALLRRELDFAHELADAANDIALALFRSADLRVDRKADRSEVTEADRRAESAIASLVLAHRPDHGLLGEEHGLTGDASSPWRWIVDPIDGTSNFVRHVPVWATLVALTHADHGPVVGVVAAPALGRRWAGARGLGATSDGRSISVSGVDRLDDAHVSVTFSSGWEALGRTGALVDLLTKAGRARGFGDFWQHMLVAEGAIDLAIDAVGLQPYDIAAIQVVVEEAGGAITDRNGERRIDTGTAISSNGRIHDEAIARLRD